MSRTVTHTTGILLLALLVTGAAAQEQEQGQEQEVRPGMSGTVKVAVAGQPAMSPAGAGKEAVTLADSDALVTRSGNTVMTSGTCLVIDDFVRQFCAANPGEISCQFQ